MKRAIEKAISGGWMPPLTDKRMKYHSFSVHGAGVYINYGTAKHGKLDTYRTYYELIFGTNLVECLVKGDYGCTIFNKPCVLDIKDKPRSAYLCFPNNIDSTCMKVNNRGCKSYKRLQNYREAHHHLRQMANIKDIEALKQYLIKLAGDTP